MGIKHLFLTWLWVYYPPNLNDLYLVDPKYLN